MSGDTGSGAKDRQPPAQPPPDKRPPPTDGRQQPPPDTTRATDKAGQQDGKGSADARGPAGPQGSPTGGKPVDAGPRQQADAGPRPSGDAGARQNVDAGPRPSGDAGAKHADGGARSADAPQRAGDQPQNWRMSDNMAQWKDKVQSDWQPRPTERATSGPADTKGGPRESQRPEKFSHTENLDRFRDSHGKLDKERLKDAFRTDIKADISARLKADLAKPAQSGDRPGYPHHTPAGTQADRQSHFRPMEVTVRVENAKSAAEVRVAQNAMTEVSKEFAVKGRVEAPGRPGDTRPEPVTPFGGSGGPGQHRTDAPVRHEPRSGQSPVMPSVPHAPIAPPVWRPIPRGR